MKKYQDCPHCGRTFVIGFWDHVARCAQEVQNHLDREWRRKQQEAVFGKPPRDPNSGAGTAI